jgi:hypothetical protein
VKWEGEEPRCWNGALEARTGHVNPPLLPLIVQLPSLPSKQNKRQLAAFAVGILYRIYLLTKYRNISYGQTHEGSSSYSLELQLTVEWCLASREDCVGGTVLLSCAVSGPVSASSVLSCPESLQIQGWGKSGGIRHSMTESGKGNY